MSGLLNTVIFLSLSAAGSADPSTGLHQAVSRGEVASVRLELGKGADPNRKNPAHLTPLHLAARQGYLEIAQLLLQSGADPNRRQDPTGSTPLHLAVEHQHEKVTRLLLEQGANPNLAARDGEGETLAPLQLAARGGDAEIAHLLLRYGARMGGRCIGCESQLLHVAARKGHAGLVRSLLAQGVDPSTPRDGLLPAQLAARHGHRELALLLGGTEPPLQAPKAEGAAGQGDLTRTRATVYGTRSSKEVLEGARQWALSFAGNLPNFVCTQITKRSDNQGQGSEARRKRHDIVTKVQFLHGAESYVTLTVNGKPSERHIREISGMGEFGSTLQALFQPDSPARFFHAGNSLVNGRPVVGFEISPPLWLLNCIRESCTTAPCRISSRSATKDPSILTKNRRRCCGSWANGSSVSRLISPFDRPASRSITDPWTSKGAPTGFLSNPGMSWWEDAAGSTRTKTSG